MGRLFGSLPGGLGISVVLVGVLLAAAKGVVGATVVTIALITLPTMLRHGYDRASPPARWRRPRRWRRSCRPRPCWCCSATSSTIRIRPRSSPRASSRRRSSAVSDLFAGAIVPGLTLVGALSRFLVAVAIAAAAGVAGDAAAIRRRRTASRCAQRLIEALIAPVAADRRGARLDPDRPCDADRGRRGRRGRRDPARRVASWPRASLRVLAPVDRRRPRRSTWMIFPILIGATLFSLVFRGLGGDDMVHRALDRPAGRRGGRDPRRDARRCSCSAS